MSNYNDNHKLDGLWELYDYYGEILASGEYKDGLMEGPWIKYWENGQLRFKGQCKSGFKVGYWEKFLDDGYVITQREFIFGEEQCP